LRIALRALRSGLARPAFLAVFSAARVRRRAIFFAPRRVFLAAVFALAAAFRAALLAGRFLAPAFFAAAFLFAGAFFAAPLRAAGFFAALRADLRAPVRRFLAAPATGSASGANVSGISVSLCIQTSTLG
jgi:hypothetical protein